MADPHSRAAIALGLEHLPSASGISADEIILSPTRAKPGRMFFVTVSLADAVDLSCIREDFVSFFDDIVTYCVAVEKSNTSVEVSNHLHAFLEFKEPVLLTNIREYISVFTDGARIDVQAARSKKTVLKYVSKEDLGLHYNCKSSDLHFNYRVFLWARSITQFNHMHPFVVEHRFCYNYLKKYYLDYRKSAVNAFDCFGNVDYFYNDWTFDVVTWWNKFSNRFVVKRPCLYLFGPPNTGKSTFVERLIGKGNTDRIFYPGVGKFFMADMDIDFYKVIIFEEFHVDYYPLSMLKRLCEGRRFAYPVKGQSDNVFAFTGPIIFVSNENDIVDIALRARLFFVSASRPYWEGSLLSIPKIESEDVVDEAVEISSDEEVAWSSVSTSSSSRI